MWWGTDEVLGNLLPAFPHKIMQASPQSYSSERQQVIDWLVSHNYPALPVAPAQSALLYHKVVQQDPERGVWQHCPLERGTLKPIPLYTGKNPSYLDRDGIPHLINHRQYQNRLPSDKELQVFFAHPENGVGTLGGWNNTVWIDFDVKQFPSQEECDAAVLKILERPELQQTFIERSHSGGWRIGVLVRQKPSFTNFSLTPGGSRVGEALFKGRFTVLAPTIGPSGNPYQSIQRTFPVEVESMEAIGIYSTKPKDVGDKGLLTGDKGLGKTLPLPQSPGSIPLELLGNGTSRDILQGNCPTDDRSEALTTATKEWYGWANWAQENDISLCGDATTLAHHAGSLLGLDSDRINRILKTIDSTACQPAALYRGGESSCWKRVRSLDKATFEAKCPAHISQAILVEQRNRRAVGVKSPVVAKGGAGGAKNAGGYSGGGGNSPGTPNPGAGSFGSFGGNGGNNNGFEEDGFSEPNDWNAPVSWKGEIGWLKPIKRTLTEIDPETGKKKPIFDEKGNPLMKWDMKFYPKCNFDFQVERELASVDGISAGGIVLQVKRSLDNHQKQVIIPSLDYGSAKDFEICMKKALGKGIVCNLKSDELKALIHVRLREYRYRGGKTYQLQDRAGQQADGHWVFDNCQIGKTGEFSLLPNSDWVFNPNLGGEEKIPKPQIAPPDPNALKRLVAVMKKWHGLQGIFPAMMGLGYAAAGVHFQEIVKRERRFPLINFIGDPGSNKSIIASNALSLVGWLGNDGFLTKVSTSKAYERLKFSGGLTLCLDDPRKSAELDDFLLNIYNVVPRDVRGNYQEPHCPLMVVSNFACGDNHPPTLSRLLQIICHVNADGDKNVWDEMLEAMRLASGALPDLIKLGYPATEIRQLASELRGHLPHAHGRVADSLALVTWYAMAVASLADFPAEEIKAYAINTLCKTANDADSQADSLANFLDKLNALHSESLAGEWNVRLVGQSEIGKAIAVSMSSVWPIVDKHFNPIYSRKVVESLIDKAGGRIKSVQKFHRSKDESLAYHRLLLNKPVDSKGNPILPSEPEMVSRRCCLIPVDKAIDFISSWRTPEPPDDPPDDGGDTPGNGGGGNTPNPTPNCDSPDDLTEPVTSVTSSYTSVTQKCNQQNLDSGGISDNSDSPVTFLEEEVVNYLAFSDDETISTSLPGSTDEQDEQLEQLGHTFIPPNDVTLVVKEAETEIEVESQRLHSRCNHEVTDVTECNQTADNSCQLAQSEDLLSHKAHITDVTRQILGCQTNGQLGALRAQVGQETFGAAYDLLSEDEQEVMPPEEEAVPLRKPKIGARIISIFSQDWHSYQVPLRKPKIGARIKYGEFTGILEAKAPNGVWFITWEISSSYRKIRERMGNPIPQLPLELKESELKLI